MDIVTTVLVLNTGGEVRPTLTLTLTLVQVEGSKVTQKEHVTPRDCCIQMRLAAWP